MEKVVHKGSDLPLVRSSPVQKPFSLPLSPYEDEEELLDDEDADPMFAKPLAKPAVAVNEHGQDMIQNSPCSHFQTLCQS